MAVNESLFPELRRTGYHLTSPRDDDIEHVLDGLCGVVYGTVVQFLRRPVSQP